MDLKDYLYRELGSWYKVEEEIKRMEKEKKVLQKEEEKE